MTVAMAIDETDENFQDEETNLSILHEGGGQKAIQEVAGQS